MFIHEALRAFHVYYKTLLYENSGESFKKTIIKNAALI